MWIIPYARIPEKAPEIDAAEKKPEILERKILRHLDRRAARRVLPPVQLLPRIER